VTVSDYVALVVAGGDEPYGEAVSIGDHMLLTAGAARAAGLADHLVAAALLHDVGHLIEAPDDEFGVHDHAVSGADWVRPRFGDLVARPVGLHIDAKRYLCAIDPTYWDGLSAASQHTLNFQGGPMSPAEAATFATRPGADDAVALRRLEDGSGKANWIAGDLDALRNELLGLLASFSLSGHGDRSPSA
jgi:[1-hydroxy-2-(trimethylamino)ethyl]phosphonate dioxygenase